MGSMPEEAQQTCSLCNKSACKFISGCYHHFHVYCLRYFADELEPGKCPVCHGPMTRSLEIEGAVRGYKEGKVKLKALHGEERLAVIRVILYEKKDNFRELLEACFKIDRLQTFCFQEAASNGHFEAVKWIIKWSIENNKKWESVAILEKCRETDDENLFNYILNYFIDNIDYRDIRSDNKNIDSNTWSCFSSAIKSFFNSDLSEDEITELKKVKPFKGATAFLLACSISNVDLLKKLIEKGADIKARDQDGRTALHYAARNSFNPDVIDFIDDLKIVSRSEGTRQFLNEVDYSKESSVEIVKKLIKLGANVNGKDAELLDVPILKAVQKKNLKCLKILIENGANLKGAHEQNIWYEACLGKDADIIKVLIENGYDINQKLKRTRNMTGLILAAYKRKFESVKILVELGADLDAFDDYGRDAIHTACYVQDPEMVEYFLGLGLITCDKEGNNLIHQAIKGLNDTCTNRWGECPDGVIEMNRKMTIKIISRLIDKIDLNAFNSNGDQPIHLTSEFSHTELVELFLSNGVKINSTDSKGRNMAHLACKQHTKAEFLQKLIELGVDLEARDKENKIPLDYCSDENLLKVLMNKQSKA